MGALLTLPVSQGSMGMIRTAGTNRGSDAVTSTHGVAYSVIWPFAAFRMGSFCGSMEACEGFVTKNAYFRKKGVAGMRD